MLRPLVFSRSVSQRMQMAVSRGSSRGISSRVPQSGQAIVTPLARSNSDTRAATFLDRASISRHFALTFGLHHFNNAASALWKGRGDGMQPYFLASHVYPCISGQHVILMDLERDKYVAVVPAHRLARWVRGWPVGEAPPTDSPPDADGKADALVSQLLAHGMLVTDARVGKPAVPVTTIRPQRSLVEFDLDTRPKASAGQLWRFGGSCLQAQLSLKLRPIQSIVEAMRERKAQPQARGPRDADPLRLRSLVTAFARLRPLFYTLRSACLL